MRQIRSEIKKRKGTINLDGGGLYISSLSVEDRNRLDSIHKLKSNRGGISNLVGSIFDIDAEVVKQSILLEQDVSEDYYKLGALSDAQTLGVGFMYFAGSMLLGDSVGLGKTPQAAAYLNLLRLDAEKEGRPFRYLYLTEKALVDQTQAELVRFTGKYVETLFGEIKDVVDWRVKYGDGFDGGIISPHSVVNQADFISWLVDVCPSGHYFDVIIVDEGSIIGNKDATITKAMWNVREFAKNKIILNATPFEANLQVFYNQLDFVDSNLLPSLTAFRDEYCVFNFGRMQSVPDAYKNVDGFKEKVKYRYYGNTRENLGAEITDSSLEILTAPLSERQKYMYNRSQMYMMINDVVSALDRSIEFNEENIPKVRLAREVIEKIPAGEPILIFSHYTESHTQLTKYFRSLGYTCDYMNGDTKRADSRRIVEEFKNKDIQILITNVDKGLNLGFCDYVIFYSYATNPNKLIQMEGRVTREFNIRNKSFYMLVMKGKEYKTLTSTVSKRMKNSADFTNSDISVIKEFLLGNVL